VAHGIVNRVVPASAFALGVVRAIVHGTFLISVLFTSFSALGSLPATILRPTGAMKLLPWSFYGLLLTPSGMLILKSAMVLSLLLGALGFLTVVTTKTSFLLVLFYQGLLRSFGHFNHDEMVAVYFILDRQPFKKDAHTAPVTRLRLSDSIDAVVAGVDVFQFGADQAASRGLEVSVCGQSAKSRDFSFA
jgi:hypothetical protein